MTSPAELEDCYGKIWDEVPVCLSVTPFRLPLLPDTVTGALEEPFDGMEPMALEDNRELVEFLKDGVARGHLHIALHGYNHYMPDWAPEYAVGKDLARKTLHGKQYIESLLKCRVSTFVPPNNTLSANGYAAVIGAGLNIINNQNYSRMNFGAVNPEALVDLAMAFQYSMRNRLGRQDEYSTRSYLSYKLAPYFSVGPPGELPELQESLRACPQDGGVFVIGTHYHAFDRKMKSGETIREGVYALVNEARTISGTEFVDYDALWG